MLATLTETSFMQHALADQLKQCRSLRRLRLRICGAGIVNASRLDFLTSPADASQPEPITRAERSLRFFDAAVYARNLADSIPSLNDVLISISLVRGVKEVVANHVGSSISEAYVECYDDGGPAWKL